MATIVRHAILEPASLSDAETERLVDSLYAVHTEIFDGVRRDEFAAYVVRSPADRTRIRVSYGEGGEIAGYLAIHVFAREVSGEPCTVMRAEAGLRRKYRGNASTASFGLSQVFQMRLEFGGPTYYLGCLVHPSSYSIMATKGGTVYPAAGVEIPPPLFDLMMKLGDEFHLEMVDPARPLVRRVGWITKDTEAERRYWQTTDLPAPRYFIEQNPGYIEGHGLLTLLPFDAGSLTKTVAKTASSLVEKRIRHAMGSLERSVLRRQLDAPTAEELLSRAEEITGLDLDAVRQHGLLGTRYPIPSRTTLCRAGERADAMYVLLEGSLFVLDESVEGEAVVIDQLGPSTLVGELALLTGEPHPFTVRAAIDSVLLRLSAKDVEALVAAEPRLGQELWHRAHGRMFGKLLRTIPRYASLSREAQEQWFAAGSSRSLATDESFAIGSDAVLVLSKGSIRIGCERRVMVFGAPAFAELPAGSTVTATSAAELAILPGEPQAAV